VNCEEDITAPFYCILFPEVKKELVEEMWILLDFFQIPNNELVKLAVKWTIRHGNKPLPSCLQTAHDNYLKQETCFVIASRQKEEIIGLEGVVRLDDVESLSCPNAIKSITEAHDFRIWLTGASFVLQVDHNTTLPVDINERLILVQLPWYLMTNQKLLLSPNIFLDASKFGQEEVGYGPTQYMFDG
jgi:hypothetical protein